MGFRHYLKHPRESAGTASCPCGGNYYRSTARGWTDQPYCIGIDPQKKQQGVSDIAPPLRCNTRQANLPPRTCPTISSHVYDNVSTPTHQARRGRFLAALPAYAWPLSIQTEYTQHARGAAQQASRAITLTTETQSIDIM